MKNIDLKEINFKDMCNLEVCKFYAEYIKSDEFQKAKQNLTYDQIIDNPLTIMETAPVPTERIDDICVAKLSKENSVVYWNFEEKWNKIIRVKSFQSGFIFYQYKFDRNNLGTIITYKDFVFHDNGSKNKYFFYYDPDNKVALAFGNHFFKRFNTRFLCAEFNPYENSKEIIRNFLKVSKKQNYIYYKNAVSGKK